MGTIQHIYSTIAINHQQTKGRGTQMADMYATCHVFDLYLQFFGHAFRLYTYKHGVQGGKIKQGRVSWVRLGIE